MNIFVLDANPKLAAQYHMDAHVRKMILESAQIMCTVNHQYGTSNVPYKPTHQNHPCVKWAGQSYQNYSWLAELGVALTTEFMHRFEKSHKTASVIYWCRQRNPCPKSHSVVPATLELCMPSVYKEYRNNDMEGAVRCYRMYYAVEKFRLAKWTKREKPPWWSHYRALYRAMTPCRTKGDLPGQQHFLFDEENR